MNSTSKVPHIRFKGFSGKWEEKKLGQLAKITTGSSNRQDSGLDGKYTFFDRSDDIRTSNIYLFDCEAVIVAGEGSDFVPKYFKGKFDLHQRTYAIMNFENGDSKFLFYYIHLFRKWFLNQAVGSTVKSLRLPMFQEMVIKYPRKDEQTKIGDYFQQLDKLIEQKEKKYQKLKQFKKAMLDKMFPKNGADTPEIRFKGFSGKWEEKRLVEFSNLIHGDGDWILAQDITTNGEYKIVQLGNIGLGKYIEKDLKTVSLKTFEALRGTPIKKGDLLINRMVDGNVNSCIFEFDGNYITSVDVCWIRENDYINNYFLMCLLIIEESQKKLLSLSSGSGRIRISKKNLFEKFYFVMPTLEEQTKIGNYFQKLDTQIELQLQEIEKLKNIKKASLSKMFV